MTSNQRQYGRTIRRPTSGSTGSFEGRAQKNGETLGKNDPKFLGQCRPLASSEPSIHLPEALCKFDCAGFLPVAISNLITRICSDSLPTYISVTSGWKETERKQNNENMKHGFVWKVPTKGIDLV